MRHTPPAPRRETPKCWRHGPHPPEHCGDIFCPACPTRFPETQAAYERIELAEHYGTYDAE